MGCKAIQNKLCVLSQDFIQKEGVNEAKKHTQWKNTQIFLRERCSSFHISQNFSLEIENFSYVMSLQQYIIISRKVTFFHWIYCMYFSIWHRNRNERGDSKRIIYFERPNSIIPILNWAVIPNWLQVKSCNPKFKPDFCKAIQNKLCVLSQDFFQKEGPCESVQ